jgi:hypothetical protein
MQLKQSFIIICLLIVNYSLINCSNTKIKKNSLNAKSNLREEFQSKSKQDGDDIEEINVEDKLREIIKEDYPDFVKDLGDGIKDPKFRKAIRHLSKLNKVVYKKLNVLTLTSQPTQNEIDIDSSLRFPLTNENRATTILNCGQNPVTIIGKPIITAANGKFVIDGHHRWSTVYVTNPNCLMTAIDLSNVRYPFNALKSVQLGIAAGVDKFGKEITKIPIETVQGKNLFKVTETELKAYVVKNIKENIVPIFTKFDKTLITKENIADYFWKNVLLMKKNCKILNGAPGRGLMPQTDLTVNYRNVSVNVDAFLLKEFMK